MNANTLNSAMVAALSELTNITKDKVNPHFKSKFTSLDAILDATRPVLARHGLALSQEPVFESGMAGVVTRIIHVGGESRESKLLLPLRDQTAQGVGSCLTYSRRYSAAAVLGIASDEDDDGNVASSPPRQRPTTAPSPFHRVETKEEKRAEVEGIEVAASPAPTEAVKENQDLKELRVLMEFAGVDDRMVLGFLERKGGKKVKAAKVDDLGQTTLKRLVEKWDDVIGKEAA